jgi:hypothetical protein
MSSKLVVVALLAVRARSAVAPGVLGRASPRANKLACEYPGASAAGPTARFETTV